LTKYNNLIYFFYSLSTSFFFFILLFLLINFEKALGFFSIFNSSTPSLVSIVIYLCIRKLNFIPSNTLMLILGILNDIMASVNLGVSSIFFLLIKLLTENLSSLNLDNNSQQSWFSFTIIFSLSIFAVVLINIVINLSIPDINPLLFHIGTTLILFPIINLAIDLIFFIFKLIKSNP